MLASENLERAVATIVSYMAEYIEEAVEAGNLEDARESAKDLANFLDGIL